MMPIDELLEARPPFGGSIRPAQTTVLGLCVGDLLQRPAIVAVRYDPHILTQGDALFGEEPTYETHYVVLGCELLPVSASVPQVAARVNTLARRLYNRDSRGDYHVLADASEIGRPVVDAIRAGILREVHVSAVTVKTGDAGDLSLLWRKEATIGLAYLISRLQAILQGARLHIPASEQTASLRDGLSSLDPSNPEQPGSVRALSVAVASEYLPVRHGPSLESLPSARF